MLPFYHIVTDDIPLHVKHLYKPRTIKNFKEDIHFLLAHYEPISLQQLLDIKRSGQPVNKNYFHLTFDDGLSEFYSIAAPILKERNIPATVFLNSDFIDNELLFYRFKASILYDKLKDNSLLSIIYENKDQLDELANDNNIDFSIYLNDKKPYLTSDQIKELIKQGFTFGAHSKDHPLYNQLTLEEQLVQTKESILSVTRKFDLDYRVFSFPFTDDMVSNKFFEEIASFTDMTFGSAGLKEDMAKNHFQRVAMETNKTGKDIIKSEYLYCLAKIKAGKNKIIRQ